MEVMDDKEQKKFLEDSGYRTVRKQMLCSCTMRTFFDLLESKLPSTLKANTQVKEGEAPKKTWESDKAFLDEFIDTLNDELKDVMIY